MKKLLLIYIGLLIGSLTSAGTYQCQLLYDKDYTEDLKAMVKTGCDTHVGNEDIEKGVAACQSVGFASVEFYQNYVKKGTSTKGTNIFHENGCYPNPMGAISLMCSKLERRVNQNECFYQTLKHASLWDRKARIIKWINVTCESLDHKHSDARLQCYKQHLAKYQFKYASIVSDPGFIKVVKQ